MNNMESLYQGFEKYFNSGREEINYFLDVLKIIKEDRWEYEYEKLTVTDTFIYIIKTLKYDNIQINYKYFFNPNDDVCYNYEITVKVNNNTIYETQDKTDELFIEILDFIERAEKRAKGE